MASPKTEHVKVILEPNASPPFHIDSGLLKGGKLVFRNQGFPGFDLYFDLEDPDNSGYLFPDDPKKALAAIEITGGGNDCPAQGQHWPQFEAMDVQNGNRTLHVRNYNQSQAKFGYSLFVTQNPAQGGPFLALDPIGQNENGPQLDGFNLSYAALAVAGVAIVAIAFALYEFGVFGR